MTQSQEFAVVTSVAVKDESAAVDMLRSRVVPMVSGLPGFVSGVWLGAEDGAGSSVLVFDSEAGARAVADRMHAASEATGLLSVQVRPVSARA
jgi:hypothetical protein